MRLRGAGLGQCSHVIGTPNERDVVEAWYDGKPSCNTRARRF